MGSLVNFPSFIDNKIIPPKIKAYEVNENSTGTKYAATKDMDIKDIAKLIRADIKASIKAGQIPDGKYAVKISRYSMGQSLDVSISDVDIQIYNVEKIYAEDRRENTDGLYIYSEEGRAILSAVQGIIDSYNFDKSKMIEDYHHQKFYGHVTYDSCFTNYKREAVIAEMRKAKE